MLRETIKAETVTAMKAKDKERTATLRLIGAKIKDRDIELRTSSKDVPDDELVTDVLTKMAKQRRESITMYVDGGREELAEQERQELAIIEEFLPQTMDEAETKAAIADAKNPNKCESAPALQDSRATMQPEENQLTTIEPAQHAAHSLNEFRLVSKQKWED